MDIKRQTTHGNQLSPTMWITLGYSGLAGSTCIQRAIREVGKKPEGHRRPAEETYRRHQCGGGGGETLGMLALGKQSQW